MDYQPGTHILLTIRNANNIKLRDTAAWMRLIDDLVKRFELQCLGQVEHTFSDSGGYTAVHCLTESHISIHTWPEYNLCTCDVFLSNFKRSNDLRAKNISETIISYFESINYELTDIKR